MLKHLNTTTAAEDVLMTQEPFPGVSQWWGI